MFGSAKNFSNPNTNVEVFMQTDHAKITEENKNALRPNINTIVFCGTHEIQNDILNLCEMIITDISGKQQLSIGMSFYDQKENM